MRNRRRKKNSDKKTLIKLMTFYVVVCWLSKCYIYIYYNRFRSWKSLAKKECGWSTTATVKICSFLSAFLCVLLLEGKCMFVYEWVSMCAYRRMDDMCLCLRNICIYVLCKSCRRSFIFASFLSVAFSYYSFLVVFLFFFLIIIVCFSLNLNNFCPWFVCGKLRAW